jgi:hypothetical protein
MEHALSRNLCDHSEIRGYLYNKDKNVTGSARLLPNTMHCNLNCVTNIALRHGWNTAHNSEVWYLNFSYTSVVVRDSCGILNAMNPILGGKGVWSSSTPSPVSVYTTGNNKTANKNERIVRMNMQSGKYTWLIDWMVCKMFFKSERQEYTRISLVKLHSFVLIFGLIVVY